MKLITVKTFDNPIEANISKARLISEQIPCFLFDENLVSLNPLYSVTVGGIKLKVHENDLERALEIISFYENAPVTDEKDETLECPNCGSTKLYSGFKSMKGFAGIISAIVSFYFMLFPIHFKTLYKCKKCGKEFKNP